MKARYKRPWAIMEDSVDVSPTGARIVRTVCVKSGERRYIDEDHYWWQGTDLTEMDADAAAMRSAMTKNDRDDVYSRVATVLKE